MIPAAFILWPLAATVALALLLAAARLARSAWRKLGSAAPLMLAAAIVATVAAQKPPAASVTWDEPFLSHSATIDTNDLHRISFAWTSAAYLPQTANAVLSAILANVAGAHVFDVTNCPMSVGAMSVRMPQAATNYLFAMTCDWTPEPSVVTNGVYHVRAVGGGERAVPIGADIITTNGTQKTRRDAQ